MRISDVFFLTVLVSTSFGVRFELNLNLCDIVEEMQWTFYIVTCKERQDKIRSKLTIMFRLFATKKPAIS